MEEENMEIERVHNTVIPEIDNALRQVLKLD